MSDYWRVSNRADPDALPLADRHYNRQKIGSPQFVPPGRCFVLLTENQTALWTTSFPFAEFTKHRWAGAWVNSLFRNERRDLHLSSDLIREAVSLTRWRYGEPPSLGMVSFINRDEVKHKRDPGRCYIRAGFEYDGETQGGLIAVRLRPDNMPPPQMPIGGQFDFAMSGEPAPPG